MSRPDDLTLEDAADATLTPEDAQRFAGWLAYREGLGDDEWDGNDPLSDDDVSLDAPEDFDAPTDDNEEPEES